MNNRRLEDIRNSLRELTRDCRYDMHEPAERGVTARVIGDHLDNAMGSSIDTELLVSGAQEFIVVIEREDGHPHVRKYNLADLIALARLADLS